MALTFFYDFTSTYSYLAVMRMEEAAAAAGVDVEWVPFILGPIFADAGYEVTPTMATPDKARYARRDLQRRARHRGLPFVLPAEFPQRSVAAGRAGLALSPAERPAFTRAMFNQLFGHGHDISDPQTLSAAAREAGLDPDKVVDSTKDEAAKKALFASVDRARAAGVFGAPSFLTSDGELFWGEVHLEDALSWETRQELAAR